MGKTRVVIIGSGPGGYVAAIRGAQLGCEVTVIEDTEVGGTCLNRGCIPTKTLIASAEVLHKTRNAEDFGLELAGNVSPNIKKIMERKRKVVDTQVKGIRGLFKSWGIKLLEGRGVIINQKKLNIALKDGSTQEIDTDKIIIATGSKPAQIPVFPFDGKRILSSDHAVNLDVIPQSLLIVGAGVIGCEFAFIYREFGSEVTMVEMLPRAVSTEDEEISALLERELKKNRIKLITNIGVQKVDVKEDGVTATLSDGKTIDAEKVLVSIGRSVNSKNLGLEDLGFNTGKRGEVIVDNKMQTNVEG